MREAQTAPSRATVVVVVVVVVVVILSVDSFTFGGVDEHRASLLEAELRYSSVSTIDGEEREEE